jgi:beta-phosphoglucomutase
MLNIKACIFDLDGVIVDTAKYHFIAWRRLANELGIDFTEAENEQLKGVSRRDSLELILKWGGVVIDEAKKTELTDRKNDWYVEFIKKMTPDEILPGVIVFLESLQSKGIKIGLGSASKNAPLILKQVGLLDSFEAVIDGGQVINGKPNPEVFLKGAAVLKVQPRQCIVFEDAAKGIDAAIDGEMIAVGVGEEAVLGHAHYVIPNFENIDYDVLLEILEEKMLPINN